MIIIYILNYKIISSVSDFFKIRLCFYINLVQVYICPWCDRMYSSEAERIGHLLSEHGVEVREDGVEVREDGVEVKEDAANTVDAKDPSSIIQGKNSDLFIKKYINVFSLNNFSLTYFYVRLGKLLSMSSIFN